MVRNGLRFADDHRSQTPGRHHRRHRSDLLDNPINETIDLSRKSEDGARLQGLHRVLADR